MQPASLLTATFHQPRVVIVLTLNPFACHPARECDPDLCKACAATCHGEAMTDGSGLECFNMKLRLHQVLRVPSSQRPSHIGSQDAHPDAGLRHVPFTSMLTLPNLNMTRPVARGFGHIYAVDLETAHVAPGTSQMCRILYICAFSPMSVTPAYAAVAAPCTAQAHRDGPLICGRLGCVPARGRAQT